MRPDEKLTGAAAGSSAVRSEARLVTICVKPSEYRASTRKSPNSAPTGKRTVSPWSLAITTSVGAPRDSTGAGTTWMGSTGLAGSIGPGGGLSGPGGTFFGAGGEATAISSFGGAFTRTSTRRVSHA